MLSADAADAADNAVATIECGRYGDMIVLVMLCNGAHSRSILHRRHHRHHMQDGSIAWFSVTKHVVSRLV
jgi:hypothetical protein